MNACESCPLNLEFAKTRVCRNEKPWGGSPAPWLSGTLSDLFTLQKAGLATRNVAGWWIPID